MDICIFRVGAPFDVKLPLNWNIAHDPAFPAYTYYAMLYASRDHRYQNVKNQRAVAVLGNVFAVTFFATRIVYYTGWLAPSMWAHSGDIGPLLTAICVAFIGLQVRA